MMQSTSITPAVEAPEAPEVRVSLRDARIARLCRRVRFVEDDLRPLCRDATEVGRLRALLAEIDEVILPRELVVMREGDSAPPLCLLVASRRLLAIDGVPVESAEAARDALSACLGRPGRYALRSDRPAAPPAPSHAGCSAARLAQLAGIDLAAPDPETPLLRFAAGLGQFSGEWVMLDARLRCTRSFGSEPQVDRLLAALNEIHALAETELGSLGVLAPGLPCCLSLGSDAAGARLVLARGDDGHILALVPEARHSATIAFWQDCLG